MGELILGWKWDLGFQAGHAINFFFGGRRPSLKSKRKNRMNYGAYMRKIASGRTTTIGFQNGQDASLNTLKRQALANTVTTTLPLTSPIPTVNSKIGGSVANILEATQQTDDPKGQKNVIVITPGNPPTTKYTTLAGYTNYTSGLRTIDTTANRIGAAQNCAVCSDAPSSAPYNIVLPCKPFLDPNSYDPNPKDRNPSSDNNTWNNPPTFTTPGNAPGKVICCDKDPSQLYRNNAEFVSQQGLQSALRTRFNLPPKRQGLRGAVYNADRQ